MAYRDVPPFAFTKGLLAELEKLPPLYSQDGKGWTAPCSLSFEFEEGTTFYVIEGSPLFGALFGLCFEDDEYKGFRIISFTHMNAFCDQLVESMMQCDCEEDGCPSLEADGIYRIEYTVYPERPMIGALYRKHVGQVDQQMVLHLPDRSNEPADEPAELPPGAIEKIVTDSFSNPNSLYNIFAP